MLQVLAILYEIVLEESIIFYVIVGSYVGMWKSTFPPCALYAL